MALKQNNNRITIFSVIIFGITSILIISVLLIWVSNRFVNSPFQNLNQPTIRIVSGSENRTLEPIIERFNEERGYNVVVEYKGSIDMLIALDRNEVQDIDAVWPASSLILNLTENDSLRHSKSIMRMPVILGVKNERAQQLGWTEDNAITVAELTEALTSRGVKLAMTNATQSNSGLSGYIAFLYAFSNSPDVLDLNNIQDETVQEKTRALLNSINRSSGSSGWLKDLFLEQYDSLDAMINYEPVIIETNQELQKQGKSPLQAVYLTDGMVIADSPLAYIEKGDSEKEKVFLELQEYLLSESTQQTLLSQGRRTDIGLTVDTSQNNLDQVFREDWGLKSDIPYVSIRLPRKEVIEEALNLYQISLRKPSFTVYVIDVSGSMAGDGIDQLKSAMRTIIDQESAKDYFLQASSRDVSVVIPFNNAVGNISRFNGNDSQTISDFLLKIDSLSAGGGTDMYSPLIEALEIIQKDASTGEYFPAVILMSDGRSDNSRAINQITNSKDVPVFPILFGDSDPSQMEDIVNRTGGRVFDGRENLVNAFREAKGYN